MVDTTYTPKVYRKDGGDSLKVASGGHIDIETGGELRLGGTAITATAAEINAAAGTGVSSTELDLLDGALAGTVVASKAAVYSATGFLARSSATLAALGNSQGTAAAVVTEFVAVTGADGTKGVVLPTSAADVPCVVINTDASNNLLVYPATGAQINALGANNGFTVTPGQMAVFIGRSATLWYTAAATDTITGLTASAAELNTNDGATAANSATGKTAILGTNGAITFAGAVTNQAAALTSFGVGAKFGAEVTAVEQGDGAFHKTILTCTAVPLTFGDEAGQGQYGGVKVYDFPAGLICALGAVIDGVMTLTAPAIDTWNGDIGLGVEAPTDHQDVANKTGQIMPKVGTTQAIAKVATTDAVSVATALTESGARWRDGTTSAIDLFLNLLIDDDALHDNTITGTFTGTITVAWMNLGTTA